MTKKHEPNEFFIEYNIHVAKKYLKASIQGLSNRMEHKHLDYDLVDMKIAKDSLKESLMLVHDAVKLLKPKTK